MNIKPNPVKLHARLSEKEIYAGKKPIESDLYKDSEKTLNVSQRALYAIETFLYLEGKQIAGPYSVIRLADDLIGLPGRIKEIPTDYEYYKVNSVIYPVIDVDSGLFIEADRWYKVNNRKISLFFPPITAGLGQADCIYTDNATTVSTPDTFYMFVVQTDQPIEIGNYNQSFQMITSAVLDSASGVFLLQNAKNFTIWFRSNNTSNVFVDDCRMQYIKSTRSIIIRQEYDAAFSDITAAQYKFIGVKKENGWFFNENSEYRTAPYTTHYNRIQFSNGIVGPFNGCSIQFSE